MSSALDSPPDKPPSGEYVAAIKFDQQPPRHIFREQWFDMTLKLDLSDSHDYIHRHPFPKVNICPQLYRYSSTHKEFRAVKHTDRFQVVMNPERVTLKLSSGANKPFVTEVKCKISCPLEEKCLAIEFIEANPYDSGIKVQPVMSQKLNMVNAKLEVNGIEWEKIWYKDMGGRDKAMQVTVKLKDENNEVVRNQRVPLHLTLVYDNDRNTKVHKQEILRKISSPNPSIDPDSGESSLQFRVEDVSKNHQKQDFMVRVEANSTENFDIAPGLTEPVTVMSKKKHKKSSTTHSSSNSYSRKRSGDDLTPPIRSHYPSIHDPAVREAMRGVIKWTEEVIHGLCPLKWDTIGYRTFQDGQADYTRPYYNMTNPNDTINRILSMYEKQTRENMRVLISAIDSQSDVYSSTTPGANIGLHLPHATIQQQPNHFNNPYNNPSVPQYSSNMQSSSFQPPPYWNNAPSTHQHLQQQQQMNVQQHQQMNIQQHQQLLHQQQQHSQRHHPTGSLAYGISERREPDMPDSWIDQEIRQEEVRYVLAQTFNIIGSNKKLGYPAYSISKELLGFYNKSSRRGEGGRFVPIHKHKQDIGPGTMGQARRIFEEAILRGDSAVFELSQNETLEEMVNRALNFENWPKTPGNDSNSSSEVGLHGTTHSPSGSF